MTRQSEIIGQEPELKRILVIGPMPPPFAGTSVSFELFCKHVSENTDKLKLSVINSAPKDVGQKPILTLGNFITAKRILFEYLKKIRKTDQVIVFCSNQFLLSFMPICLFIAKLIKKPFYVRCFGGSLDIFYGGMNPIVRKYFHWVLKNTDGLIVQTESLERFFSKRLVGKVHQVSGYRCIQSPYKIDDRIVDDSGNFNLLYIGHIREEKGIFDLLEGLRKLSPAELQTINCDLYGPVYQEVSTRFKAEIAITEKANYRGVLKPNEVIPMLMQCDAFVFPSYYKGEGHPGVLIEAIMSGIPCIATDFRSIPELIEHRVNGWLVAPNKPQELIDAIRYLRDDRELLAAMSRQCMQDRDKYAAAELIPKILEPLGLRL